ncbi:MAG: hypothetical protein V4539_09650 [Bacteroidota bacterium]
MSVPPNVMEAAIKKGINRKTAVLIVILVIMVGLKFLIFDFVVPKTAAFTIPQKWKMIPLRQTREIVHGYLGDPLPEANVNGADKWASGSKDKMYYLRIYYVSDTIALGYSVHYQYKNWFSSRDYLIDSFSIR